VENEVELRDKQITKQINGNFHNMGSADEKKKKILN
jgi:hypothetical protein